MAGQLYQIAVSDRSGVEGEFMFHLTAPPPPPIVGAPGPSPNFAVGFGLNVLGVAGQSYAVQASTNLVDWQTITVDTVQGDDTKFIDEDAGLFPHRFYRVLPLEAVLSPSRLTVSLNPSDPGGVTARIAGPAGQPFSLRASSDLVHWQEINRGWVTGDYMEYVDADATGLAARFYQVAPLP